MRDQDLLNKLGTAPQSERMPVLFVGHGNPMNAIEENSFSETWQRVGSELPMPQAILSISAHWLTKGTRVTAMAAPRTIHDFGGFPQALFDVEYPAPGSPDVARETANILSPKHVLLDDEWGFDHGTWSVLHKMYPLAQVPVIQLSLDYNLSPAQHYELAKSLRPLRDRGVLIMGSGNVVHNLRAMRFDGGVYDWALEFDAFVAKSINEQNDTALVDFQTLGSLAQLAHPTIEHYLPLLYSIALRDEHDRHSFFNEAIDFGSGSMRSVIYQ